MDEKAILARELADAFTQFKKLQWHNNAFKQIKKSEFMLLKTMMDSMGPEGRGVKPSELSSKLEVTPAAVTHMINALEKKQYVERLSDPKDRRVVFVRPTEKSIGIINGMREDFLNNFKDLAISLGEKDSRELIRLLTLTYQCFKELKDKSAMKK